MKFGLQWDIWLYLLYYIYSFCCVSQTKIDNISHTRVVTFINATEIGFPLSHVDVVFIFGRLLQRNLYDIPACSCRCSCSL